MKPTRQRKQFMKKSRKVKNMEKRRTRGKKMTRLRKSGTRKFGGVAGPHLISIKATEFPMDTDNPTDYVVKESPTLPAASASLTTSTDTHSSTVSKRPVIFQNTDWSGDNLAFKTAEANKKAAASEARAKAAEEAVAALEVKMKAADEAVAASEARANAADEAVATEKAAAAEAARIAAEKAAAEKAEAVKKEGIEWGAAWRAWRGSKAVEAVRAAAGREWWELCRRYWQEMMAVEEKGVIHHGVTKATWDIWKNIWKSNMAVLKAAAAEANAVAMLEAGAAGAAERAAAAVKVGNAVDTVEMVAAAVRSAADDFGGAVARGGVTWKDVMAAREGRVEGETEPWGGWARMDAAAVTAAAAMQDKKIDINSLFTAISYAETAAAAANEEAVITNDSAAAKAVVLKIKGYLHSISMYNQPRSRR